MENLQAIFFLLLSAVLLVGIAQKIHLPYPIMLVLGGAAISFIPGINNISFNSSFILLIFLPPILYYSAFGISFREFQLNWKSIFSLALGLVVLTTIVLGVLFKWIFPQFSWGLAFAFGAIVSPPDAIAVTSVLRQFDINPRLITLLEGESLINDASAIVIYKVAIAALMTGSLSLNEGVYDFFHGVIGGITVGFVLGFLFQKFSKHYLEPVLGVVFSFTIAYVTYIVADILNVSGVLAVVVNGLIGARILDTHHSSLRRVLGYAVWDILIIVLNCLVFILIGLQVKTIVGEMSIQQIMSYSGFAFLIAFAMSVVRMIWVYGRAAILYINALQRHDFSQICPQIIRESAIIGWAGMRGIVSLALALALPLTFPNGMPLEGRNETIFISFVVILITLLIPGLTLPVLIRWLKLCLNNKDDNEKRIRNQLAQHADEIIFSILESKTINQKEYRFLKSYFRLQHKALAQVHDAEGNISNIESARRKVIQFQRKKLLEIKKTHEVDDQLLSHLENELDMLETHIARAQLKLY